MKKLRLLLFLMVAVLGSWASSGSMVHAAEKASHTMTVSPPQQRIILKPGEVYEGTLKISNAVDSIVDLKYSATVGSFSLRKDENGNVNYNDTDVDTITEYNEIMDWITLGKTEGTVSPNTVDVLPFTINVPLDAPAGGQYATIIVQDDTEENNGQNGNVTIKNVVRFAASILTEVTGNTREEAEILENNIPSLVMSNGLSASSRVKNDGNVHTDASYVLRVWPLFSNEEICTNEEDPTKSLVLPGTERFHSETCAVPSLGIFKVKQTVEIFGEVSEAEKWVIVCPLWLLFVVIFALILLALWIIARAKTSKKHEV